MVVDQNFRIIGTGSYLPRRVVDAEAMDARIGRPLGWCREHIGVQLRYECLPPEDLVTMAEQAIKAAVVDANIDWSAIDAIIDCSTSQYRPIPCNAAHYQERFLPHAARIPCFDVQSTCLGSIVALNLINGLFASGAYRNIVLVASETGMGGINYRQPESACLIGDGAGAMVLERSPGYGFISYGHETYAEHLSLCRVEAGGHRRSVFTYDERDREQFQFSMDGPALFRVAMKRLKPMVTRVKSEYQTKYPKILDEMIQWVPHQASPRALALVREQLAVRPDRFHQAIEQVGNLVAASIPVMVDRLRRGAKIQSGDHMMLLGTSAGYSQAALLLRL